MFESPFFRLFQHSLQLPCVLLICLSLYTICNIVYKPQALPHGTVWDSMGQYGTVWDSMGQYGTVWDSMGQYGTVWDSMGQYGTVWDSMGQYGTVWDSMDENSNFLLHLD